MFKENQDIFNILLGSVSEGVIIVDDQQTIVEANESAIKMFGYKAKELLKKPLNILIPLNYHANHSSHFNGFMKDKKKRRMGQHADRNAQFGNIARLKQEYLDTVCPVISIHTKKKEMLGKFYRDDVTDAIEPTIVNDHDFPKQ